MCNIRQQTPVLNLYVYMWVWVFGIGLLCFILCMYVPFFLFPSSLLFVPSSPFLPLSPPTFFYSSFSTLLPPSPQANSSSRVRCCVLRPSWSIFKPTLPLQPARQASPLQPSWHFSVQAERGERRTSRWWSGGMQPSYPTEGEAPKMCLVSSPEPALSQGAPSPISWLAHAFATIVTKKRSKQYPFEKCLDTQDFVVVREVLHVCRNQQSRNLIRLLVISQRNSN